MAIVLFWIPLLFCTAPHCSLATTIRRCMLQPNTSAGVRSTAYICLLGMLTATWSFTGYDSAAHLIEETKSADTSAGYPILYAIVLSFAVGLVYLLTLTICIQVVPLDTAVVHSSSAWKLHADLLCEPSYRCCTVPGCDLRLCAGMFIKLGCGVHIEQYQSALQQHNIAQSMLH